MRNIKRTIQLKQNGRRGKRYYKNIKYPEIPTKDEDLYIITRVGDRLDMLASHFYDNPDLWWVIASANPNVIKNGSFGVKSGLEIRIPSNHINVISDFNTLNK